MIEYVNIGMNIHSSSVIEKREQRCLEWEKSTPFSTKTGLGGSRMLRVT